MNKQVEIRNVHGEYIMETLSSPVQRAKGECIAFRLASGCVCVCLRLRCPSPMCPPRLFTQIASLGSTPRARMSRSRSHHSFGRVYVKRSAEAKPRNRVAVQPNNKQGRKVISGVCFHHPKLAHTPSIPGYSEGLYDR